MTWLAFSNGITLALQTIRTHKLRAFLTVLGVIIGTGTIIGVSAILTGFDATITGVLRSFGPNSIIVFKFPVGFRVTNLSPEERTRKNLTYENALHIKERCGSAQDVSAMLFQNRNIVNARYKGNDMYDVNLMGVDEAYANGGQVDIHRGRFIAEQESQRRMPVVVIGADIEKGLFGAIDPIGKTINVDGHQFEVIGTMLRPSASFFGDTDNRVLLPYWTMQRMYPNARENAIVVTARDGQLPKALDEIRTSLRIDRRVRFNMPDNFALSTAEQMVADFSPDHRDDVSGHGDAEFGRSPGGWDWRHEYHAGVGNRTHARDRSAKSSRRPEKRHSDSVSAGSVGFDGSRRHSGNNFWLDHFSHYQTRFDSLPATVPLWSAVLGIVVSVGVGLFFGIWPANKAAKLDPVVALRYE